MFERVLCLCAVLALGGCASLDPARDWRDHSWTRGDTYAEVTWQFINVVDAVQTAQIADTPGVVEANPVTRSVLGPEPSKSGTAMYFATLGVSHFLISRLLPASWRPYWHNSTIMLGSVNAIRNCTEFNLLCKE